MLNVQELGRWERTKRATFVAFCVGFCVLLMACVLRFIPPLDDALSGRPQYLHAITDQMARSLAQNTNHEIPVLVRHDESYDCDQTQNVPSRDTEDLYYVFAYSENMKLLCFITYQPAETRTGLENPQLLGSKSNESYGEPLRKDLLAEPIAHFSLKFPDSYLILLHWRTRVDPAHLAHAGNAQLRRAIPQSMPLTDVDISVQLPELRKSVARNHNILNATLLCLIVVSGLAVALSSINGARLYRRMALECDRYGSQLRVREFLTGDLYFIGAEAERTYRIAQHAAAKELRKETLLRQSLEELKGRLAGLLEAADCEAEKRKIERVLESCDLTEMEQVAQEVEAQLGQVRPEERLLSLAESVEQFCAPEELETLRTEALKILQESGFRSARSFLVRVHDDLRLRAKLRAVEEEEVKLDHGTTQSD